MIFLIPFFFLLEDSSLESTGVAFVAVEPSALLVVVAGWSAAVEDPAAAGAALASVAGAALASAAGAGVGVDEPVAFGLATAALAVGEALLSGAGLTVVPGVFTSGEVAPGGAAVVAGWESGPVLIISTPTFGCALPAAGPVVASTGVTVSVPVSAGVCEFALPPATVNDGPCAPGRSTSVAETTSFGGLSCGVPPWAAVVKSGSPLIIDIGIFNAMIW